MRRSIGAMDVRPPRWPLHIRKLQCSLQCTDRPRASPAVSFSEHSCACAWKGRYVESNIAKQRGVLAVRLRSGWSVPARSQIAVLTDCGLCPIAGYANALVLKSRFVRFGRHHKTYILKAERPPYEPNLSPHVSRSSPRAKIVFWLPVDGFAPSV